MIPGPGHEFQVSRCASSRAEVERNTNIPVDEADRDCGSREGVYVTGSVPVVVVAQVLIHVNPEWFSLSVEIFPVARPSPGGMVSDKALSVRRRRAVLPMMLTILSAGRVLSTCLHRPKAAAQTSVADYPTGTQNVHI